MGVLAQGSVLLASVGIGSVGLGSVDSLCAQDGFRAKFTAAEAIPVADADTRRSAFAVAYAVFSEFAADSSEYTSALPDGARAAVYSGRYRASITLFQRLAALGRLDDDALRISLIAMVRAGDGSGAVRLAKLRIEIRAEAVHAWLRGRVEWLPRTSDFGRLAALGGALLQAGDADGLWLLREQDRAMRGRPGREFALANLGLAYRQLGRGADAERTYREGLKLVPRTDWLWNDFGLLLKGLGRVDEAFQAFVSGMKQEAKPGDSAAGTNLGVLFQRTGESRNRRPQADLQRVVASRPDAAMARRLLLDGLPNRR